ncbi:MAG: tRNA pseudouridine(55) synthase TruB [Spirochaetaceae bacterium]|nr:tRNA pseudouridine(55) synthase TruB [Spirochaetaceae bacterium]
MSAQDRLSNPPGFALLRKPEGITSFQALGPVKRATGITKVGHAGTLDRFARGLLIALWGSYSRLSNYIASGQKAYVGTVRFGEETDTLDPEGRVVARSDPPDRQTIEEALARFRGNVVQKPPAFSAVHVDGTRAYKLARAGKEPELKDREVIISELELRSFDGVDAVVALRCSAGTYVRSLARDLALACGSRAHLVALERTAIGPFHVEDAIGPEEFDPARDALRFAPDHASALGLRPLFLAEGRERGFNNGCRLEQSLFAPDTGSLLEMAGACAVFSSSGAMLGVIELEPRSAIYRLVLAGASS